MVALSIQQGMIEISQKENIMPTPLISSLGFQPDILQGETVLITGAGGGIGFETARALLWLGANVVIAEINAQNGDKAAQALNAEFAGQRALFVQTDVGDEAGVQNLRDASLGKFGKVDAVLNNATIAALGLVTDLPIQEWDASYRVNLRGPVLLARAFLPDMIARGHGAFACVSSTGTAYMGSYETFKAAQVHLANTLDAELEGTGVYAYTIGPGLVPTPTAQAAVSRLAPMLGMSVDEFFKQNKNAVISIEEAGTGFAISLVKAEKFKGMEISSMQALKAVDIHYGSEGEEPGITLDGEAKERSIELCRQVRQTLKEQSEGWKRRSLFERQWVIRDFKKTAGMSAEEWLDVLSRLEDCLRGGLDFARPPLLNLAKYYNHLAELAKGYEKNPARLEENLKHVYRWRDEVDQLKKSLETEKQ
jgi:NAD(P)-dependent dehydrogenase (short-subunit alcohol dehydrogenase family)